MNDVDRSIHSENNKMDLNEQGKSIQQRKTKKNFVF